MRSARHQRLKIIRSAERQPCVNVTFVRGSRVLRVVSKEPPGEVSVDLVRDGEARRTGWHERPRRRGFMESSHVGLNKPDTYENSSLGAAGRNPSESMKVARNAARWC